jgi:hypothetical protein
MSLAEAIQAEAEACSKYESLLLQALDAAGPIAHWGDGNGGHLIERFFHHLEAIGYWQKEPVSLAYVKKQIPAGLRTQVFERDLYRCVHCGTHKALCVDHIFPESLGGPIELDNLQTLCRPCNSWKGAKA